MKIGRGNRSTRRKPTPVPLCPPQNPTWQNRSRTPDRSDGKPATNRLSYGAAFFLVPFRRLLRLAGSRWRYSTSPLHGCTHTVKILSHNIHDTRKQRSLAHTWLSLFTSMQRFNILQCVAVVTRICRMTLINLTLTEIFNICRRGICLILFIFRRMFCVHCVSETGFLSKI
jgi:hypothetical protein